GWGTSTISRVKNNLFGYTAYDSDPLESATAFNSRADCINFVIPLIKKNYLQSTGKYFVRQACLGNKSYGMNVHYASDSGWGAGIASIARMIEKFARQH
ncbi:MAG: glucosaminidase domain-containing protein, partial [Terriglobales bacterium]